MRDKVLTRAIIISVVVHLVAVTFIGRTSGTRLNAAGMIPVQQRLMNVELVKDPLSDPPKPKPVVVPPTDPFNNRAPAPNDPRTVRVPNKAGGPLNTGTNSARGDIPNLGKGRTSVGIVPGDSGPGKGHGQAPGVNPSDPPKIIQPVTVPIPTPPPPPPPPPPQPKRVTVTVCDVSKMLAGEYCKSTHKESFNEGDEPKHKCDKCKAPEPTHGRVADQAIPKLTHDVAPRIPDSVPEGQSLEVEIEYYVDTDGGVSGVRVTKSSGDRSLDRAVTSAASQWRYNPAVQDGTPRRVKVSRMVRCKT